MKKVLAMLLSLTLVVTLTIGGSIAYLQDTDSDVNVMTLGNVTIEQHEYERELNADGTYKTDTIDNKTSYVLKDFTQEKPLLPIVGDPNEPGDSPAYAGWDDTTVRMSQVDSYGGMNVFAGKNAQDKFVTVENTGKTEAFVRTIVAIEIGSANPELIGTSYHQTWAKNDIVNVEINGNKYNVIEYVYKGAQLDDGTYRHENGVLPAGDTTYPNLAQVYLKSKATNEDMVAIDGNGNGKLDMLVLSQAVQAAGFESAQVALDTAFGAANETNVKKWFGDVISEEEENQFVQNYARRSYAIDTANMTDADITKAARMLKENNACDSLIVNGEMTEEQQVVLADALDGMADDSVVIVLNDNDTIADELKKHNAVEYAFDKTGFVKEGNNYVIGSAEGLEAWRAEKKGDVSLKADITLPETNWQPINIFNSEDPFVFDGEGHTIYNMNITDGSADAGFFGSCVGDIKNLNFEDINLKTSGRSAIVAAKLYGDIENCHVKNAVIEDSYWATGVIAGLYNAGDIKNCTVTNVTVKSNGGTGGIVGVINETSGTRTVENCHVIDSTVHNTGVYGEAYSGGGIVGMVNISNSTVNITGCSTKNVKLEGQHIFEICGPVDNDITLNID